MATAPPLEQVLANVVPGRSHRLRLNERQRRGLEDRDGRIALLVIRALVRARRGGDLAVKPTNRATPTQSRFLSPEPFPLTEDAFQAIARRLGLSIGDKRDKSDHQALYRAEGARGRRLLPSAIPKVSRPVRLSGPPLSPRNVRPG
jgi:hypothetical protein